MTIRRVNPKTRAFELDSLQLLCLPYDDPCPYKTGDLWFMSFDGTTPTGFACVRPLAREPGVWYLARAGVLPAYQGRGLQKQLIAARVRAVRRAGGSTILTDCTTVNYASANSLIAQGFRMFKPGHAWALPNSLYWRLRLKEPSCGNTT